MLSGGVVYPIMLHRLFDHVGFAWGVRISAFVSGTGCVVATLLTSRSSCLPQEKKVESKPSIRIWTDIRYTLLALGAGLVALGEASDLLNASSFHQWVC